ncbi:MAG: hypothetical protein DCC46_00600 [Armatimonadetes bacterium]|nr:MAG: hypothetical protein DCC46_00600 [Armatimonadota bacterium]
MTGGLKGRDTIGRMPQSLATVLVHAVFSKKDRTPWLAPAIRQELHPYIVGVLANIGCPSIQTGGVEDHVHALCCRSMNGICGIESRPFRPHSFYGIGPCPGLRPSLLDERPFGPTWRQGRPPAEQALPPRCQIARILVQGFALRSWMNGPSGLRGDKGARRPGRPADKMPAIA